MKEYVDKLPGGVSKNLFIRRAIQKAMKDENFWDYMEDNQSGR